MALFLQRILYQLLLLLALPVIPLRLALRGLRERGYWRHLGERFGATAALPRDAVWIHAVSVGEARAAAPIVERLLAQASPPAVLMTCMTPAGRATLMQLFGTRVTVHYLPYDFRFAVGRFLRRARPRLGVIMETELWPNLVDACRRVQVPVYLVNARLSARSARGYRRLAALTSATLDAFEAIAAQTQADAQRLMELGARRVRVTGNLKFDIEPPPEQVALAATFRARIGNRPVWLVASTRDGEERRVIDAFLGASRGDALLVLAPRHPQRFDEVAALVRRAGLSMQRRSRNETVHGATQVWLGDSMGEMFAYYAAADCALIGGSLLPYGGQNLIEACAVGCPVLVGPHTENFKHATDDAIERGAALRVHDAAQWCDAAVRLTRDEVARRRMAVAGRAFARAHRGAAEQVYVMLADRLKPPGTPV